MSSMLNNVPASRSRLALSKIQFVWLFGVLFWGVGTAILFSLMMAWQEGISQMAIILPVSLAIFPAGGWLWGQLMWRLLRLGSKSAN